MLITYELNLTTFEAWSGGEDTLSRILDEDKENEFIALLEEQYPDGIDETALNDLLRFEADWVYHSLGMMTDEEKERAEEEEDEREKAREAIKDFEDCDSLCEHFDGDCDKCPLSRWGCGGTYCGETFDELKEEDD